MRDLTNLRGKLQFICGNWHKFHFQKISNFLAKKLPKDIGTKASIRVYKKFIMKQWQLIQNFSKFLVKLLILFYDF